ncbi:unnamed protein product [Leuciscus chuanchicus]
MGFNLIPHPDCERALGSQSGAEVNTYLPPPSGESPTTNLQKIQDSSDFIEESFVAAMLLSVNDGSVLLEDGQCPLKLTSIEIFPLWLLAAQAHFIEFWLAEPTALDGNLSAQGTDVFHTIGEKDLCGVKQEKCPWTLLLVEE